MKFKDKDGIRVLKHKDSEGDRIEVDHYGAKSAYLYFSVNEDTPAVQMSKKKARKFAEAILKELDA